MHSSLKIVCNKENGGGVGNLMFLKFLISLLKWYLPTAVSFITASHTLTKRVLQSILLLRLSFLKIAFTFHFFCRNFRMSDILAEPLFDWFINIYRPSTFSCKEKKSIITVCHYTSPFHLWKWAPKKSIFTSIQSTTLPCIILRASFIRYLLPQHSVSTFKIEKVFGSMETLPAIQKMLV